MFHTVFPSLNRLVVSAAALFAFSAGIAHAQVVPAPSTPQVGSSNPATAAPPFHVQAVLLTAILKKAGGNLGWALLGFGQYHWPACGWYRTLTLTTERRYTR
jgi:hypothetical protein